MELEDQILNDQNPGNGPSNKDQKTEGNDSLLDLERQVYGNKAILSQQNTMDLNQSLQI